MAKRRQQTPAVKVDAFGEAIEACAFCEKDAMRFPQEMLSVEQDGVTLTPVKLPICATCLHNVFDDTEREYAYTADGRTQLIGFAA